MNCPNNAVKKSFFIRTFGCKVNQYESQAMREMLLSAGFVEALSKERADICLLNTCTVTSRADKEARYFINLLHRKNPDAKIVLTGCLAEDGAGPVASMPGISAVIPNKDKSRLAHILQSNDERRTTNDEHAAGDALSITTFKNHAKAFLKIQDGCENFCSYCKVPYVRGKFYSKPIGDITNEIKALVSNGFQEIILTGICLGAWGRDRGEGVGLVEALKEIDLIPGDFRIRLSSIELKYVTDELLHYMAKHSRICRHLHIPLQSGDDDILKKMNRPYTSAQFLSTVNSAYEMIPGLAVTTDVMIGFPGETNVNFRNTVNTIKDIGPLRVHIFTFSRREGTAAYKMDSPDTSEILAGRYAEIAAVSIDTSHIFRLRFIGSTMKVLAETKRDKGTGFLSGYTDNYIKVRFDAPDSVMKRMIPVTITNAEQHSTTGACV